MKDFNKIRKEDWQRERDEQAVNKEIEKGLIGRMSPTRAGVIALINLKRKELGYGKKK